jgi:hypothetical protein
MEGHGMKRIKSNTVTVATAFPGVHITDAVKEAKTAGVPFLIFNDRLFQAPDFDEQVAFARLTDTEAEAEHRRKTAV